MSLLFYFVKTICGKLLKRWEYQTTWPASWEICIQVKKQQLELDIEQQPGSKLGKESIKAVYCHPCGDPRGEWADKTKEGLGVQKWKNQTLIILPSPML